jgi:hypothetical protein
MNHDDDDYDRDRSYLGEVLKRIAKENQLSTAEFLARLLEAIDQIADELPEHQAQTIVEIVSRI